MPRTKAESLQNEGGHNNIDITNSNTNYKFIDSNTIDDEEISDEEPYDANEISNRFSNSGDADRTRLYDDAINKRFNNKS